MPQVPEVTFLGSPAFFGEGMNGANLAVQTAQDQIDIANEYIKRLGELVGNLQIPTINPVFPQPVDAPAISIPAPPTLNPVTWNAPTFPNPFNGTLDVNDIMPDPFDEDPPALIIPGAPADFVEATPDAPGVNVDFVYPDLEVVLPDAPALMSLVINKFDGVNLPTFDEVVPELNIQEPGRFVYTPGALYTSALLTSLKTSLQDRIDNGGTGLKPEIEQAIWDRGRDREARAKRDALDSLEQFEELGYALPPGVYLDARIKIETETEYNNANYSREIAIKQAELEQSNVLKALENATSLEGRFIDYANQTEQRAFEAARYSSQAGIEIYNAKVRAYSAYVDAYRVKAAVYETKLKGELAKIDAYKAEIEAETAKATLNRALVDQYRAQIEAALSSIEVFKARIAAIQAKADIEKLKISIYGEQVRGYVARISAYTARVDAYKSAISAEATKQDAYRAKVQAYSARVEAQVKVIDARIKEYQSLIAAKQAEYDGYKANVAGESARVQAIVQGNQSTVDGYKAEVTGRAAYNETLTKQWEAAISIAAKNAEIGIAAAKANAELYVTTRQLAIEASKVGAQVSAQLGAAALNAINYNNSISYSNSNSSSRSGSASDSASKSESESKSENYNYNQSI